MQRKRILLIVVAVSMMLLMWLSLAIFLLSENVGSVDAKPFLISSSLRALSDPTARPSANSQPAPILSGGNDTTAIPVALIGLAGVVIGALIAGAFAVYQLRRTAHLEQKRQVELFRHEQELARLQKELEAQYKAKEQEEQRETTKAEASRIAMLLAQNIQDRANAYREALRADPRIARLQILDMSRPLEVTNVYVRVRVHQETRLAYELDPVLLAAETQHDPNALLQAVQLRLESRISSALDADEAIRTYKRCVVVGDPGAGKTTLLKYLALKSAEKQLRGLPDLPIHIELNAFASSEHRDLLDFASANWDEKYGFPRDEARAYMEENLKDGKALLLLDALDETMIGENGDMAEASYKRVTDAIIRIATHYYQAPIVVTARKAGYQQRAPLAGFTELEVLDFRPEDIRQFVTNWFACYLDPQKRANAIELNSRLERNPRIQTLAANPLLLSLIVIVYEAQLDLPDRRAELYKRCVDTLLTEWDAKRNIRRRREFKPEHKRQLLEEIAWHFHTKGRRYFPESELLEVIADFLPRVRLPVEHNRRVLEEIANEHGLLKEQARGWHGFLHLTLQEYFAAQYVTDHNQLDTLLTYIGDPWWEEVLLLYAGHTSDASPLLRKLLGQDKQIHLQEDLFQTNLIVAGRCLVARPTVREVTLWEEITSRLFKSMMATQYSLTREQIADTLAAIGGNDVNAHLLGLLTDAQLDQASRLGVAEALGRSAEQSVAPDLLRLLSNERIDRTLRRSIAKALGMLGERSVTIDLLHLLSSDQVDLLIRQSIAEALGTLGERSVVSDLVQLLSSDQVEIPLRQSIAEALGRLGERSVALNLLRLLSNEQTDQEVRWSIAKALGMLGERSVASDLLRLLSNEYIEQRTRWSIAEALGMLGERSVASDLLRLLINKQIDTSVRRSIVEALGMLGERLVIPDLLHLLFDKQIDISVHWGIADALGRLGERSVIPDLLQLLSNENVDRRIRQGIAGTLGRLSEQSIVPGLLHLLSNKRVDVLVRWSIAEAIGRLGQKSAVPDLLRLVSNEQIDVLVRQSIIGALGQLANDEATVHALVTLLQTSDIANEIHTVLWTVSRRARVRILISDDPTAVLIETVKW